MTGQDFLQLTAEEEAMLAGEEGPGVRRAMEMVVALARIYGARNLVPITSAQVAGVSYVNLGDAGLEFLQQWADEGACVRVPAMLNPAGMDLEAWQALGTSEEFAAKQREVIAAYARLGVDATCTCAPYLAETADVSLGDHLAWSESSAVSYANSVLGARTNREGGPGALAAAITGRTGNYGLHLDENRQPVASFLVASPLRGLADWGALGAWVGRNSRGVPWLFLSDEAATVFAAAGKATQRDWLRSFGAAAAATGSVALYHLAGITTEAALGLVSFPAQKPRAIEAEDLEAAVGSLDGETDRIDVVAVGCPHASLEQVALLASQLAGKRLQLPLWIMVSRETKRRAEEQRLVAPLENAGARLVCDTCVVVAPLRDMGIRAVATDSAKAASYLPSHQKVSVRFGSTERCLDAALRGCWQ